MKVSRTFVKLFKYNADSKVSKPIDEQINTYVADTCDSEDLIEIKQITYMQPHMSLVTKALVVFERFKRNA